MTKNIDTYDFTYSKRYVKRNNKKTKVILNNLVKLENFLDIGCNQGYVSKSILEKGLAIKGCGIELNRNVIDKWLLSSKNFQLFEGDVMDFQFDKNYDLIIFNSLHHHIFGKFGKIKSWILWNKIIDHCGKVLIFETGNINEKGDYYWKNKIKKYFNNQEEYINELLKAIGPRLKKVEIIASLKIHGVKRPIYKILLHPLKSKFDIKNNLFNIYGDYYKSYNEWELIKCFNRTIGRKNQKLIDVEESNNYYSSQIYYGVKFFLLKNKRSGKRAFGKKIIDDPIKQIREFYINSNINNTRITKIFEVNDTYGLIFSFKPWEKLGNVDFLNVGNKKQFEKEIILFFKDIKTIFINTDFFDIEPKIFKQRRSLYKIVDFHPNNFLLQIENNNIKNWTVVDMEYFSNNNTLRNKMHLKSILKQLKTPLYKRILRV